MKLFELAERLNCKLEGDGELDEGVLVVGE